MLGGQFGPQPERAGSAQASANQRDRVAAGAGVPTPTRSDGRERHHPQASDVVSVDKAEAPAVSRNVVAASYHRDSTRSGHEEGRMRSVRFCVWAGEHSA
jgi:hypothetical protein